MIKFIKADDSKINDIIDLAHKSWFQTYEKINSKDQLKILSNNGNNQTNSLPNIEKLEESTIFGKMNNLKNQYKNHNSQIKMMFGSDFES